MRSQQTVVVVGATGYLGMEICRQLSDACYDVRGIVRISSNEEKIYNLQQLGVVDVRKVPVEALKEQKAAASDPLTESFAALMIAYANGSHINMEKTLTILPVECTTVREYARTMMPQATEVV